MELSKIFIKNNKIKNFLQAVQNGDDVIISGLNDSRLSFFISGIYSHLERNLVLVTYDKGQYNRLLEDMLRLMPEENILLFPGYEVLPHEQLEPNISVVRERINCLQKLQQQENQVVVVTYGMALVRGLVPVSNFMKQSFCLQIGDIVEREKITEKLSTSGYKRVEMVDSIRQFSVRGGIIDIFPPAVEKPFRIEFFGDEVESIRSFDPGSQRSKEKVKEVNVPPAREVFFTEDSVCDRIPIIERDFNKAVKRLRDTDRDREADYLRKKGVKVQEDLRVKRYFPGCEQFLHYFYNSLASFFDYLAGDSVLVFDGAYRVWKRLESHYRDLRENQISLLEQGSIIPGYESNFWDADVLKEKALENQIVDASGQYSGKTFVNTEKEFVFFGRGVEPYHGQIKMFVDRIKQLLQEDFRIVVTLNSAAKVERIADYLRDKGLSVTQKSCFPRKNQVLIQGESLSKGFIIEELNLAVFTEKEVMGNPQKKKRKMTDLEEGTEVSSFAELEAGDYVVHENHGIGKYMGIETLEVQGQHQDYLVLKYEGNDKLYVPTSQVHLVQKYIGSDGKPPKLYSLGGSDWKKVKQKVQNSVKEMAVGLLELYAERETVEGYAFSRDTVWQKEFEETFPYEETPDQLQAIKEVKEDMESRKPMDRLLCGDVGYGKTEVAIRAAFKAAVDGKQTAVLVPTTILAQQHYNTFTERISKYPINVEMLSRFKTPSEQKKILNDLEKGKVEIIIGTHRLFSSDVKFNDLGLLIIDEEQRFGVSHKEKLKDIKRDVDVLTLTATPIPRTLHMALVGVRDMSVIETPPENRYPIRTYLREFNRDLIKEAIRREVGRDGQVYFVHNRVEDIDKKASMIRDLLPEVRVAVAHGQMNENHLENLMLKFYNQEYDVLVCTTIIESGLDIPNVNTIIINRAENMGLAQLYQLRGRVGRSNRVAYAYLLYQKDKVLPEVAEKRLQAIKEFTNLGSGFKIAMRDLEIRGAGNLLGPEQHGHIASVGFSLYCKLLEQAIEDLKGKSKEEIKVEIDLTVDAYIPDSYISDSRQKVEVYKKIRKVDSDSKIAELEKELADRFGPIPEKVEKLIFIRNLAIFAKDLGIEEIRQKGDMVDCIFISKDYLHGDKIINLVNAYPDIIKVKSAEKPVISIRVSRQEVLETLRQVLEKYGDLVSSN
ncbi:MAG: transcription-repair coupling factor [Halanaerobiales bacterium]